MNPTKQGHRAAAQSSTPVCPHPEGSPEQASWRAAVTHVEAFRAIGRDPNGHEPPPPHLCTCNPAAVCNCCHACTKACRTERLLSITGALEAIGRIGQSLVRKL